MTAEEQVKALQEQVERLQKKLETVTESRDAIIKSQNVVIKSQNDTIQTLDKKVHSLESELYWLRKKIFGKMSEKNLPIDPTSLERTLFDDIMTDEEKSGLQAKIAKEEADRNRLIEVKSFQRAVRKPINVDNLE